MNTLHLISKDDRYKPYRFLFSQHSLNLTNIHPHLLHTISSKVKICSQVESFEFIPLVPCPLLPVKQTLLMDRKICNNLER
jgi:hypothetical protein